MGSRSPKFRSDVIVSEQESPAGAFFVVRDPLTGQSFRFRAPEHFIARQLDGATPLETVRQRVHDRFGEPLPSQQLTNFLKALERHGLLEASGGANGTGRGRTGSAPAKLRRESGLPKFRSDVIVSEQETAEGTFFVIKDPVTGGFFRFRAPEHFITQQLDGATPLETVRERVRDRFGEPLSSDELRSFLKTLKGYGLLEENGAERGHAVRRGLVRGNLFLLQFKGFDPDRILTYLATGLRFLFMRWFVVFSAAVILAGVATTVIHWDAILRDFTRLYRLHTMLFAWLTILIVGMAHEFAHGLVCKHFGGSVREIGFMLLYLQPALYCNVSDAWLFPERAKRLWVTFAGAYFELFLWGLATLAWRVTAPETWLNLAALVVMATSGLKTLFNLNPLIKLDGYYFLSDYLEIPNLRKRSFEFLMGLLRGRVKDSSPRERWIFLAYGLVAGAFTIWFTLWVVVRLGTYLTGFYQGLGFVLFTLLLVPLVKTRLRRFLPEPGTRKTASDRATTSDQATTWVRPAATLAVVGAAVAGLFLVHLPLKITGDFTVLPLRNLEVRTEVEGPVETVYVKEGDVVRAGAPVARLSERAYRAELSRVEAAIAQAEARLRMLTAGPTPQDVEVAKRELATARLRAVGARQRLANAERIRAGQRAKAEIAVAKAEERLAYARMNLDRMREASQVGAVALNQREDAEAQAALRAKELEEARRDLSLVVTDTLPEARSDVAVTTTEVGQAEARLTRLLAGSRREEIDAARAEIAGFEATRRHLETQVGLSTVTSPIDGVITTPARRLQDLVGKLVKPGDVVATVNELRTLTIEIAVPEKEIADVSVGQRVVFKALAYPERAFQGEVTSIATTVGDGPNAAGNAAVVAVGAPVGAPRTVRVITRLDNSENLLKPEMTGKAKIFAGDRSIADLLTRRLARFLKVEFWSWW